MVAKTLYTLKSGFVLDRATFIQKSAYEMAAIITAINGDLLVVDSAEAFFNANNLITLIAKKDWRHKLVNEEIHFFTNDQLAAIMAAMPPENAAHLAEPPAKEYVFHGGQAVAEIEPAQAVEEDVIVKAPIWAGYEFHPIPVKWSVGNKMSLGPTKIKVKDSDFSMNPVEYERLWLYASQIWCGNKKSVPTVFETGLGVRTANVGPNHVAFGHIALKRYEIEQVAKYRKWDFPAKIADGILAA